MLTLFKLTSIVITNSFIAWLMKMMINFTFTQLPDSGQHVDVKFSILNGD